MPYENIKVGLFVSTKDGTRLLGTTTDPEIVERVRAEILAQLEAEHHDLADAPLRLVGDDSSCGEES